MDRRQLWRRIRRAWMTLGIATAVVFVGWSLVAYRASAEAQLATRSDSSVTVKHDHQIWSFVPRRPTGARVPALVFLPGALVDPAAYAPLVHAAATTGFPAFIVELRIGTLVGFDNQSIAQQAFDCAVERAWSKTDLAAGVFRDFLHDPVAV